MTDRKPIAVLGGSGKEGGGLALRWAHAGHRVIIGSRTAERAAEAAAALRDRLGRGADLTGMANPDAAAAADIVDVVARLTIDDDSFGRPILVSAPPRAPGHGS